MRFYKLNGVWQSWDYLHNELGYAEHATRPTVFKSCADATWGEDAGNGYYDGDVNDMINGTFWTDADPTGWFSLDGLVWNSETYPADATPSLLVKDGVASDALVITCDDGNYYLIRAIIDTTAWIPESEVEALGWRSPSFVVVDSTTGKVVSGCNQELTTYELPSVVLNSEDGYETYELPSISLAVPKMVIGVPISGPVQAFWFSLYELAVPLSFMQYDGNMFEADSDSDTVRYLPTTERLTLSIPGDSTTRGKSAWSVQCAKLFVLSYANTQLPDVQIELPINEVGTYGTQITLPTIDGEYESGGKTWKPSAWDIGAFGSSYSLTGDVVAHLVFEEVQQYQEIALYYSNNYKAYQTGVTSAFTGNVNANYCYQLYTDEQCTIPWTGYDYSNDYEVGWYNDGVWEPLISKIEDMPNTTSGARKNGFILMDTGCMWLCTNVSSSSTYNTGTQAFIRIYPKGQQWIPVFPYNPSYGEYDNLTINRKGTFVRMSSHATVFGTFPAIAESFGYKSGMIKSASIQTELQISQATLYLIVVGNPSLSNIIVRFENDICTGYARSDKSDLPTAPSYDGATYTLKDDDGNNIDYDDSFTYKFVLLLNSTGNTVGGTNSTGAMIKSSTGKLQVRVRYMSSKFNRVWYYRIPIS